MMIGEKIKKLKIKIAAVYLAFKKKETPFYAKVAAFITITYALSPIDLIPDFIPVLGYLDDFIILPILILVAVKLIPKEIMQQCEKEAIGIWNDGKPKRWIYALPIIMVWLFLISLILYLIL